MLTAILRSGHRHSPDRGRHSESILWLTGFVALAIAWTWPLVLHFTSRIPHDPGDSLLNIWLI